MSIADDIGQGGYAFVVARRRIPCPQFRYAQFTHLPRRRTTARLARSPRQVLVADNAALTARQLECLRLIADGETSAEIAASLGLSKRTIDHYVQFACAKLGVRNRTQAVAKAIQLDLIAALQTPRPRA